MSESPRIELELHGRPDRGELVPLRTFARAVDSLTDLLVQMAADRSSRVKLDFFVSDLRKGSAVLQIEGRAIATSDGAEVEAVMQSTVTASAALESGQELRGVFSYQALEKDRVLANLKNDGAGGVLLRGFGKQVQMTGTGAERAREVLARRYFSFGSVEGTVETVSIHEAEPYFNVFHALDGYAIKCRCDFALLERAKEVLGSRIQVIGAIERRYDGRAEQVDAMDLRLLGSGGELPQISDIRGSPTMNR